MNTKAQMRPATALRWLGVILSIIGAADLVVNLFTSPISWSGALIGAALIVVGIAIFKARSN